MDTPDTVDKVAVKRGRPKKQDPATPMGEFIAEQAKVSRDKKAESRVVEKYYEMCGNKLSIVKKVAGGTVYKTFIGSTSDKKDGKQVQEFVVKLQKEGRLRIKV